MKITCDSCGSKYTIADAKVAGRKVKVRCKGCKESILVDGTQIGEGAEAPADTGDEADSTEDAPADDTPKKDLWSVNLSDEDSRDMTLDELVAGWKDGTVTPDAYVWKDGMGDWKPILEVGELKLKLGSPKKGGVVSSAAAAPATQAAATGEKKMDDLFGGVDFAGDEPAEQPKPAGAPLGGGAGKPTGARNDSSVLFSLDSLKSGAGAPKKERSTEADLFGDLGGGGAGLSTNSDLLMAPAKDPPPAPIGARVSTPVAAPSKSKVPLIAAIVGGALVIAAVLFFTLGGSGGDDAAAAEAKKAAEEAKAELEAERQKLAEEREKMMAELKKAREEAVAKGEDPAEAEEKRKAELEEKKEEEAEEKPEETAASAAPSPSPTTSSSPSPKPSPAPTTAPPFNIGAAKVALGAAAANAAACAQPGGPTGTGKVQVTFAPSGRVTSSNVVSGPFGGTAVGGCVASTFRRARVPAFSGGSQTVAKSFRIN